MASTYIQYAKGGTDYRTKSTISCWVKRSKLGVQQDIWSWGENNSSDAYLRFDTADNIEMHCDGAGGSFNSTSLYRDVNGWFHLVFSLDGSNSTANMRRRFWINGVQIDEGSGKNDIAAFSAAVIGWHSTQDFWVGARARSQQTGDIEYFDGLISHFHYCSNYSYAASDFGETDATTGEWKIKVSPNVQYGSEGFFLKMENSSNMDLDSSGNNKTLTTSGTLTKTEDCPSNVFATLNVLERLGSNITVSNGNTQFFNQASDWRTIISNLAFPNTGKFYAEMQVNEVSSAVQVGIMAQSSFVSHFQADLGTQGQYNGYAYMNTGQKRTNNSASNYGGSFAGGIIGIAVDMDNKNIYFSKDGTWQNSGNPESGATGTGAAFTDLQIDKDYCFAVASQGSNPKVSWNFGNGYFGTTAVSSAGTNASGIGIFEYDVPTGYTALSTKGLNL